MRRFRITGIDRDSGLETSVIIEALSQQSAEIEALQRGVAIRDVEELIVDETAALLDRAMQDMRSTMQSEPAAPSHPVLRPAFSVPPAAYWRAFERSVAKGVFFGLLAWTMLPFVIVAVLIAIGLVFGD